MKKNLTLYEQLLTIPISENNHAFNDEDFSTSRDGNGPSEYVLNNIFNYAKALSVVKLKQTADYNIILN